MVGAKEELCAVALLFPILAVVSLAQSHGSYSTWFSFPSFGNDDSNQLKYMGNASCSSSGGYIDLTPSPNTTSGTSHEYSGMYNSVGRVLYREPIKVWPATFTTTFTIFVKEIPLPDGLKNFNGDGLAFIIVPNDGPFLPDSSGGSLGLFDSSTDGNTTNQCWNVNSNCKLQADVGSVGRHLSSETDHVFSGRLKHIAPTFREQNIPAKGSDAIW